jgi:hypothetical protein
MHKTRAFAHAVALSVAFLLTSSAEATGISEIRDDIRTALRRSAETGEKVVVRGINLGGESLSDIEFEQMHVWAADGVVAIHGADGNVERQPPPSIQTFKGRILNSDDDASWVYASLRPNGAVEGMALAGNRRFAIGTAIPLGNIRHRNTDELDMSRSPVLIREHDVIDDLKNGRLKGFTCDVDKLPFSGKLSLPISEEQKAKLRQRADAGNVTGATYILRLTLETDTELRAAFASDAAVTAYLTDLIAKANIIYQRDLNTTLVIGHSNIYGGGTDPWTTSAASGTFALLLELGTYYATTGAGNANYGLTQRSAVAWISGRVTNGGIAWNEVLCNTDFYCGDTGANCGSGSAAFKYGGAYSFNGSISPIATTVHDPNSTENGVQYGMPTAFTSDNDFWMLAELAHELGHNVASPHTHCVGLSAGEKITYGVTRDFVDECYTGEGGCFSGTQAAPAELGTIMSYCHNLWDDGVFYRKSRFLFWKTGETSEKMQPILKGGLEGATANPTITNGSTPIPCAAGQSASVASCGGCTYAWQITGGAITSATNTSSITYTPSEASTTLTVTITTSRGCGITLAKTLTTACGAAPNAPTGVVATATGTTQVTITWNAAIGAASYRVYRRAPGGSFTLVGSPATTNYVDNTAVANTAYLYKVRSFSGVESTDSNIDLATTVIFTDPTLTAGTTSVKAVHFTELRTAVDAVRTLAGLGAGSYTDAVLNSSVTVKRLHVIDLRTAIDAARADGDVAQSAMVYTDPTITAGSTTVKKAHIDDLRNAVK